MALKELDGSGLGFWRLIVIILLLATFFSINENYLHFDFKFNNSSVNQDTNQENSTEDKDVKDNVNLNSGLDFNYKVSKVIDGDTLEIKNLDGSKMSNGKEEIKIRLIGINTPESVDPRKPVECFGKEASDYAKNLALGREVALEIDDSQSLIDKYGRQLAYIYVKTSGWIGSNYFMLNKKLIANGYAYEYTYDTPYKYQSLFQDLENQAKERGLGLWNSETCNGLKNATSNSLSS